MSKFFAVVIFALLFAFQAKADSLWIEADATGQIGKPQLIKVIFGSYNQYRLQKVSNPDFMEMKEFTCWLVSPTGKHIALQFSAGDTSYNAMFTPEENGVYVALVENKLRRVEDWSNSSTKIGITQQHYYGRTTIKVGSNAQIAKPVLTDLTILKDNESQAGPDVTLKVLLHGKPVPNAALTMRLPQMDEQKLTTDKDGKVNFHASKNGRYFALVVLRFEEGGTFKGVSYDVLREKASLILDL